MESLTRHLLVRQSNIWWTHVAYFAEAEGMKRSVIRPFHLCMLVSEKAPRSGSE